MEAKTEEKTETTTRESRVKWHAGEFIDSGASNPEIRLLDEKVEPSKVKDEVVALAKECLGEGAWLVVGIDERRVKVLKVTETKATFG